MKILFWIFAIYGLTQILVESYICKAFRDIWIDIPIIYRFITCFLCVSVWVSVGASWVFYSPYLDIFDANYGMITSQTLFYDAMFGSAIVWFLHVIENKLS